MSNYVYALLNKLSVAVAPIIATIEAGTLSVPAPWRPPEWSRGPALTSITVPAEAAGASATVYVFDAVLRVEHSRELRATEHPIQASARSPVSSIVDHAFQVPARVSLDILMSDAVQSYTASNWTSNKSKSVSAYALLVSLLEGAKLVTLTTRLATYTDMLVESVRPNDSVRTLHGLRAQVTLRQVYFADATAVSSGVLYSFDDTTQPLSSDPQTTGATPKGTAQALPPSAAVATQNAVTPQTLANFANVPAVPGAGAWSSVSVGRLKTLLT